VIEVSSKCGARREIAKGLVEEIEKEAVMEHATVCDRMITNIPPMTDPLGRYWKQPSPSRIALDETHALMDSATFNALEEYSSSIPSGVYEGKMWKRHDGAFDAAFVRSGGRPVWLLCWFGPSEKPDMVSINKREILRVD